MALTVIQRPRHELYSEVNPTPYDSPYYVSTWNASALPIVYKLESDLFPTNYVDSVDDIGSVSNYNGYVQLDLTGTYHTYVIGDYIKITNSSNDFYNGVWQIRYIINPFTIVINCKYDTSATGNVQKYYQNYNAKIKVYTGLPANHPLYSQKPMELIATIPVTPDPSNICYVNIQEAIKRSLPFDNLIDTNNINAFTGFYIEFAENYTQGGLDYTSNFEQDIFTSCNTSQQIANGTFDSDLSGWFQTTDYGNSWSQNSGKAEATGFGFTEVLFQPIDINYGKKYSLSLNFTKTGIADVWLYVYLFNAEDLESLYFPVVYAQLASTSISVDITALSDYQYVGFQIFRKRAQTVTLDNITLQLDGSEDCVPILYASNSAQQFRYRYNGSMGEYSISPNKLVPGKWMTGSWSPTLFKDNYLDLSIIIPEGVSEALDNSGKLGLFTSQYDSNGQLLSSRVSSIEMYGEGVYRLPITPIEEDTKGTLSVQLRTPIVSDYALFLNGVNHLRQNYYSDIEFQRTDSFSIYWKGIVNAYSSYSIVSDEEVGNKGYRVDLGIDGKITFIFRDNSPAFAFATTQFPITYSENETELLIVYTPTGVSFYQDGSLLTTWTYTNNLVSTVEYGTFMYVGHSPDDTTVNSIYNSDLRIYNTDITPSEVDDLDNIVYRLPFYEGEGIAVGNLYGTGAVLNGAQDTDRGSGNTWVYISDLQPVSDPLAPNEYYEVTNDNLSEELTVNYEPSCYKYPLYITWLNTLGGWDYWLFTAKKGYGIDVDDVVIGERNIYQSFPDNFQNETWEEVISLEAREKISVRSQPMTLEQQAQVAKIVYSKMVQLMNSEDDKYTVLVDKRSIELRTDGDKLHFIEFDILLPKKITQ